MADQCDATWTSTDGQHSFRCRRPWNHGDISPAAPPSEIAQAALHLSDPLDGTPLEPIVAWRSKP